MKITFFSTHCPMCQILEAKLKDKNIKYEEVNDVKAMMAKGMRAAPALEVDGALMGFGEAVKWVNEQEAKFEN